MSHTPGPWHQESMPAGIWVWSPNNLLVAYVPHEEDGPIVAAAPALLEALEATPCRHEHPSAVKAWAWLDCIEYDCKEPCQRCAVIAAARGEA